MKTLNRLNGVYESHLKKSSLPSCNNQNGRQCRTQYDNNRTVN